MARIACPHDDELTAYLVGDLPTGRQDEIADHVDTCTICKPVLDQQWKSAKDDLTMALRNADKTDKAEIYAGEPELQQATAFIENFLQERPRGANRGPRESPLPPGLQPGENAQETAQVALDQPDGQRVTSNVLDLANAGGDVQRTQSVHISNDYDRRTTAPLERPENENRFTLSLKQPFKRWQELQDAPTSNRVGYILGWVCAIAGVVGVIATICYFLFS